MRELHPIPLKTFDFNWMKKTAKIIILPLIVLPLIFSACKKETTYKKPNIILIMADDMGFSDMGAMGGEIKTPVLDGLVSDGILYKQFYNGARCCPTRASLMTGLQPHQTGMGWMTVRNLGTDSYAGELNHNCVTIAEVLKEAGYNTYMSGKWHVVADENTTQEGDKNAWPVQRGFDRYFGTLVGDGSYYTPRALTSQNTIIKAPEGFYYTDAISDTAVSMIQQNKKKNAPFFMYVSYTAPHWPLHAAEKDFEPYIEKYKIGWDSLRVERFNRQKALGIIDEDWTLSERNPEAQAWNSLTEERKVDMTKRMAIYAAQIEVMDRGIGRILMELEKEGELDNTLIFFLQDNGGCAEFISERSNDIADLGTDKSWESYRLPWANASNTPFRMFKHWTHEGGIATPLIIYWPEGIVNSGRTSERPGQLMDIMTTCVEVSGAKYPTQYKGNEIHPMEGESLVQSIEYKSDERIADLYWEHEANRAVRIGDWKLVMMASNRFPFEGKWELYNLAEDRTETNDLAEKYPEKLDEMKAKWDEWAQRVNVYPLDNRPWYARLRNPTALSKQFLEGEK